jgi:hypothetical protein
MARALLLVVATLALAGCGVANALGFPWPPGGGGGVVPGEWTCEPDRRGSGDGCDCGCGEPDPDCADTTFDSCDRFGCPVIQVSATENHICSVPGLWTCAPHWYGDGDCDCTCGVLDPECDVQECWECDDALFNDGSSCECGCLEEDPDCADATSTTECDAFPVCPHPDNTPDDSLGSCIPPDGWTCGPFSYGTNDGCDLDCGLIDPDC